MRAQNWMKILIENSAAWQSHYRLHFQAIWTTCNDYWLAIEWELGKYKKCENLQTTSTPTIHRLNYWEREHVQKKEIQI